MAVQILHGKFEDDKMSLNERNVSENFYEMDMKNSIDADVKQPNIMLDEFLNSRLAFFEHAVIHHDLKPFNILIYKEESQHQTLQWKNDFKFKQPLAKNGKMTSQMLDNSSTSCKNLNKHKASIPKSYPIFQQKRKKIAQHVSFVVVLTILFGSLFFDLSIKPPHMKVQSVSIWDSLLGLFGFMAFVWAVAIMILVGVPFIRVQSVVLVFWAILMHLKSE